jgi:ribosomal protein S18 acetylase RimI-like enzyme
MKALKIRAAALADANDVGRLHAHAWQTTYHQLAPSAAIEQLDVAHRQYQWRQLLAQQTPDQIILVAEIDRMVVGMILGGPANVPQFGDRAEVKYLYVEPAHARQGIGRLLLSRLASALRQRGHHSIALGVVAENESALRFYEALGGRQEGHYVDPGPIWRSDNLIYVWDDIDGLCSMAGSVG